MDATSPIVLLRRASRAGVISVVTLVLGALYLVRFCAPKLNDLAVKAPRAAFDPEVAPQLSTTAADLVWNIVFGCAVIAVGIVMAIVATYAAGRARALMDPA